MSYKDRYGITTIKGEGREALSISWDYENDQRKDKFPVLLYTPTVGELNHHHIELTQEEAKDLYKWLKDYFEDLDSYDGENV